MIPPLRNLVAYLLVSVSLAAVKPVETVQKHLEDATPRTIVFPRISKLKHHQKDDLFTDYFFNSQQQRHIIGRQSQGKKTIEEESFLENPLPARIAQNKWRVALVNRKYNERANERRTSKENGQLMLFPSKDGLGNNILGLNPLGSSVLTEKPNQKSGSPTSSQTPPFDLEQPQRASTTSFRSLTQTRLARIDRSQYKTALIKSDGYILFRNTPDQDSNGWDTDLYYKNQQALTRFDISEQPSLRVTTSAPRISDPSPMKKENPLELSQLVEPNLYQYSSKYFFTIDSPVQTFIYIPDPDKHSLASNLPPPQARTYNQDITTSYIHTTDKTTGLYNPLKKSDRPKLKIMDAIVGNNINSPRTISRWFNTRTTAVHFIPKHNQFTITTTPKTPNPWSDNCIKNIPSSKVNQISSSSGYSVNYIPETINNTETITVDSIKRHRRIHLHDRVKFFEYYDPGYDDYVGGGEATPTDAAPSGSSQKLICTTQMQSDSLLDVVSIGSETDILIGSKETQRDSRSVVSSDVDSTISESYISTQFPQSELARWNEYPYMALYIFKPAEVYCDSVSISQHWLVSSATCLVRHESLRDTQGLEPLESAYVTYCGPRWDQPARINYVTYAAAHPHYRQDSEYLRAVYNVGLIKVGSTMEACGESRPAVLQPHPFVPQSGGVEGVAIGWGLNRFSNRDQNIGQEPTLRHLTMLPVYVHPGSTCIKEEYISNATYCVSLPPTLMGDRPCRAWKGRGRETCGGVLLVGGKVIGLWLEEKCEWSGARAAVFSSVVSAAGWIRQTAVEHTDADVPLEM